VEGLATATFFVMTTAADTFEGLWKKHLEPNKPATTLTPEQQRNYDALLARVNDKYAQQGRAA
jgi:peptidoglycan/xylan/chitin deacetylase (PgdA/CDA1 family)